MATVWQYITASGVLVVAMTAIVTKVVNQRFDEMERREKDRARLEKIMICRTDKMSGMVELMADKLHEQGIINGDLEALRQAYAVTDREYEEYLRELLARQMR